MFNIFKIVVKKRKISLKNTLKSMFFKDIFSICEV